MELSELSKIEEDFEFYCKEYGVEDACKDIDDAFLKLHEAVRFKSKIKDIEAINELCKMLYDFEMKFKEAFIRKLVYATGD